MGSGRRESLTGQKEEPDSGSRPSRRALLAGGISQDSFPVTHHDAPSWGTTCPPPFPNPGLQAAKPTSRKSAFTSEALRSNGGRDREALGGQWEGE